METPTGEQGQPVPDELVCFIIGPIGDKLSDAGTEARRSYEDAILTRENVIEPACHEAGLATPIRADSYTVAGEITEQIFRHLRDADVVIADLTDANPNVMYELGLRHTKNLLTIQIGEKSRLPFDVQSIRTVVFRRTEGGYIDAKNTLREMLEQGLAGRFDPVTATRVWNEDGGGSDGVGTAGGPQVPDPDSSQPLDKTQYAVEASDSDDGEDEPPGYIELLVDLEDAFPRVNETILEIGEITQEFGQIARQGRSEIEEQDAKGAGARGRLVVAIRFAEQLDDPIERFENAGSRLRADASMVDRGLAHVFEVVRSGMYDPSEVDEIESGLSSMVQASDAWAEVRPSIEGFRDTVEGLGKIARPVRTRVQRLTKAIDQMLDTLTAFERWGKQAEQLLTRVRTPPEDLKNGDEPSPS